MTVILLARAQLDYEAQARPYGGSTIAQTAFGGISAAPLALDRLHGASSPEGVVP
jgi:hypothetical protein